MSRKAKAKGSLIHGIINVILPIVAVLLHQGVLGTSNTNNAWNYFIVGILFALVPVISSVIGIVVANVRLKGSSETAKKPDFSYQ